MPRFICENLVKTEPDQSLECMTRGLLSVVLVVTVLPEHLMLSNSFVLVNHPFHVDGGRTTNGLAARL